MRYFGALTVLDRGGRVRRRAWVNGEFLLRIPGSTITVTAGRPLGDAAPELIGTQVNYLPHVDIFTQAGMGPYAATAEDMTADDWAEV